MVVENSGSHSAKQQRVAEKGLKDASASAGFETAALQMFAPSALTAVVGVVAVQPNPSIAVQTSSAAVVEVVAAVVCRSRSDKSHYWRRSRGTPMPLPKSKVKV